MAKRNPLDKVFDNITNDFRRRLTTAKTSKVVPLGQEQVTPAQFRTRFSTMTEVERKKVLDENGQAEVLKMLGKG